MRAIRLLFLLSLAAVGWLATVAADAARAQGKDDPQDADAEQAAPEKLGKLSLTLNPGGHTASIRRVLFTPDSKQVITFGMDHTVRIWDAATGETRRILRPPGVSGLGMAAALSRDGLRLAVAARYPEGDKFVPVIYVFHLADGRIERVLKGKAGKASDYRTFAFSPDGKRLAAGSNATRIWDLDGDGPPQVLKTTGKGQKGATTGVAFSPDGKRLACILSTSSGHIFDLATGKAVVLQGGKGFDAVAWSPDGKVVATAGLDGGRLFEPDGTLRAHFFQEHAARSVAFSADSKKVLVTYNQKGGYHRAALYDIAGGPPQVVFAPSGKEGAGKGLPPQGVRDGVLAANGTLAATTGGGNGVHETFLWRTADATVVYRLAAPTWIHAPTARAGWSGDGKSVSWGAAGSFHLTELQLQPPLPKEDFHGVLRTQGPLSLAGDTGKSLKIQRDGQPLAVVKIGPGGAGLAAKDRTQTFVGADRLALTGGRGGFFLYEVASGNLLRTFRGHRGVVAAIAPSPQDGGRYLLSVSRDQTLRIWDPNQDRQLLTLYVSGNDWILWTPEGYYAATPGGERLMGWTLDNGIDKETSYYPAERFRKQLYRPDVLKLVLEKGSVAEALKAADAALGKQTQETNAAELLPPRASLAVLDQKDRPRVKLRASATASARGQLVTALRLLVDGRPLPEGAAHDEFKGEQEAKAEWTVTLPPGRHALAVLARSPDASSISEAIEVVCPAPARKAALHVLAVGIDVYQDPGIGSLQAARADAQAIAASFAKTCKGPLFPAVESMQLVNDKATRAAVLKELDALRHRVGSDDLVVVFFAGHGVKDKDKFYLLTEDARLKDLANTALSGEDLRKSLGEFPCQVLLMLDACHSAAGLKSFRPAVEDVTRNLTDDEVGVAVLCAAMSHEKALEKEGHGLFTRAIVEGLSRRDRVPYNYRDQRQYLHHLHAFIFDEVKGASEDRQHPFLSLPSVVESFALRQLTLESSGQ